MANLCKITIFITFSFSVYLLIINASPESDILLTFKASINDPLNSLKDWSNSTDSHHCNWTGISCSTSSSSVYGLNLQRLNLSGEISAVICDLPNLTNLNLADNFFNQPIPLHLSECESLVNLNLSNNLVWGTIPDQISQFVSLRFLDFGKNHIEGNIPESIGLLKHLQVLIFCSNLLSGEIPNMFGNFTELSVLDLSQNPFLESEIPKGVAELSKLEKIYLRNSGLYGEINTSFFVGLKNLAILDLSQNNLSGTIPRIELSLPKVVSFDVSDNKLSGNFPSGVCSGKGLKNLILHSNFLNGSIPNESISDCVNLERFEVHNNVFSEDFPSLLWSLPKIKIIRAENNRFSGAIPDSISNAAQLEQVEIDNNSFGGEIPSTLGMVKTLYKFSVSMNGLVGEIPPSFCDSTVMSIINMSYNYLSGEIPELRNCKKLVSLSLSHNHFIGEIPRSLSQLPVLTYLDLSINNLTGSIPEELQNLKLALFNVSFNRLSGRVPSPLITGPPASSVQGNPGLCGLGLKDSCIDDKKAHKIPALVLTLISIALALSIIMVVGLYMIRFRSIKQGSEEGVWKSVFFYPLRVTERDLIMAMDEKAKRGNGEVYVVNLPSGEPVAVKKLENLGKVSSKSLRAEVKTLAKIRHKNIAKILGFCHSSDSILLIYEYLGKGSLGDLLKKSNFELAWSVRLRISLGVAQGLAYIHRDYLPHLLHRNLKSCNVLLDDDFEPKITDFALDRIIGEAAFQSSLASVPSASCYLPPEFGYTKKATEQMDTYNFGVILLELVTGRKAEQTEQGDVVKWVRRKINISNGAVQLLDPKISGSNRQQMLGALEIALRCIAVTPDKRPSMSDVVRSLQSLSLKNESTNLEVSGSGNASVPP